MRWAAVLALLLVSLATPRAARGQGNYRSTPVGGRSALLGHTGVALGRDGSSPFTNPATIVRIADQKLAFSVNFYSLDATWLTAWHQPGPVDPSRFGALALKDTTLSYPSFDALPSTLCVFLGLGASFGEEEQANDALKGQEVVPAHAGRQKLAVCAANVERDEFGFTGDAFRGESAPLVTHQTQSVLRTWNRFAFGPTYAIDVSNKLSLGISLHGTASTYRNIWSISSLTYDAGGRAISSAFNKGARGLSIDVAAILGATYRHGSDTFGVALHSPAIHVLGSASSTYHSQYSGSGEASALGAGRGEFSAPPPPRISIAAGRELERGLVEISATYAFALPEGIRSRLTGREVTVSGGTATERAVQVDVTERFDPVLNASVGLEYYVNPGFSVLSGFSTDFSAQPPLVGTGTSLATFSQSRTTRMALSLGVGTHGAAGELLVGTQLSYGWGQMYAVNSYQLPPNFVVVDHRELGVLFVVAGTTSLRTLRKVVENVGDIVKPDRR